ncbi:MAG: class I SAM-dependent methyltransferase [Pirellulales bacterium]|nr:class I SAM-dependent methyltransferase [Pirellulales bacterium]
MNLIDLAESGSLPDWLIRKGIRRLLAARLRKEGRGNVEQQRAAQAGFIEELQQSPIAIATDAANEQHYEVPAKFFQQVLGPRLKYSCCYFPSANSTLTEAEDAMLGLFCERAELVDGMEILELGCGWGSLCLWMAQQYPSARIMAVSNSQSQRQFIESQALEQKINNLEVVTANIADFTTERRFDRVVSVEMFEHVRNYQLLMRHITEWLNPQGKLMVHIFCHRHLVYPFETEGADNWMGRHFFTGGIMPSDDLLLHFQEDLVLQKRWSVCGTQYARTLEAWLLNCDRYRHDLLELFKADLGDREGPRQLQRWRMFFMACAELFNYYGGKEWFVSHYLFRKR